MRKRREAREMAARWRERVCEAERVQYGAGMLGALICWPPSGGCRPRRATRSRRVARVASRRRRWPRSPLLAAVLVVAGVVVLELLAAIVRAL